MNWLVGFLGCNREVILSHFSNEENSTRLEMDASPPAELYLEKPMHRKGIPDSVEPEIEKSTFSGFIKEIDILDYIQLLMLTGRNVVVEVRSENGQEGKLFLREGKVLHAECGDVQGEAAFYECLSFAGGSFVDLDWTDPEKTTVDKPGEFLLLEAAQSRDERRENCRSEKIRQDLLCSDAKARGSMLTILLVDGMWSLVAVINDGLKAYGHNLLAAYSGRHALEMLKKVHVDVVICELLLPDTDGWQVAKAIRVGCEERGGNKPLFIILTGALPKTDGQGKMADSGVDFIIRKPVDIRRLESVVQSVYRRGQGTRDLVHGRDWAGFELDLWDVSRDPIQKV